MASSEDAMTTTLHISRRRTERPGTRPVAVVISCALVRTSR